MSRARDRVRALLLSCAAALACICVAPGPFGSARAELPPPPAALRVLLVGNSYTRFNVMPSLLAKLAASAPEGAPLRVDFEAQGGSTLRRHWLAGRVQALIRSGHYTHVVLQDHSLRPVDRPAEFHEYVARFKQLIDGVSARTVLYGTWPRHPSARLYRQHPLLRSFGEMAELVDGAYRAAARQLGADLAPVGPAFERALVEQPQLEIYKPDATHPTMAGSFLAACVIYGTITGGDPRAAQYAPWELGPEQAQLVKQVAAAALGLPGTAGPAIAPAPAIDPAVEPVSEPVAELRAEPAAASSELVSDPSAVERELCETLR